jgi:hypothetical protein
MIPPPLFSSVINVTFDSKKWPCRRGLLDGISTLITYTVQYGRKKHSETPQSAKRVRLTFDFIERCEARGD